MKGLARLLVLASLFLCFPASGGERILLFASSAAVSPESVLTVREEITVRIEGREIRHGIYRDFPTDYRTAGGTVRVGFSLRSASLDGSPVPWKTERVSNGVRVYLGDPASMAPRGDHTYALVYETTGQIGFFKGFDELYWNVTGNQWAFPMEKASFRLAIPGEGGFSSVDVYTGRQGEKGSDGVVLEDSSVETTRELSPGEGLTVAYRWPKGLVSPPDPSLGELVFHVYGVWFLACAPLLLLAYYAWAWWRWGNDPPGHPVVPLFHPSQGNGPGFLRYVKNMKMDNSCFAAEVLNLAVKGFLVIEELSLEEMMERRGKIGREGILRGVVSIASKLAGRKYILKLRRDRLSKQSASRTEMLLVSALFTSWREELILEQENHRILSNARKDLEDHFKTQARPLFSRNTPQWLAGLFIPAAIYVLFAFGGRPEISVLAGGVTILLIVLFFLLANALFADNGRGLARRILGLVFPLLIIGGQGAVFFFALGSEGIPFLMPPLAVTALVILFRKLLTVRSPRGVLVLEEAQGLAMYMGTAERHRLEMLSPPDETPETFERLLPYAFALDTAETWANRFEQVLKSRNYNPSWYTGSAVPTSFHSGGASASLALASSLSGSIASASTAPGRSSGGGGGGRSGGGGGGGGGGGW